MKIVSNAFGERAVLKLMYASLIRASDSWRGIQVKPFEARQIAALRDQLDADHAKRNIPQIMKSEAAAPSRKSSKNRT